MIVEIDAQEQKLLNIKPNLISEFEKHMVKKGLAQNTIKSYMSTFEIMQKELGGIFNVPLSEIESYLNKFCFSTRAIRLTAIRCLERFAVDCGCLASSKARFGSIPYGSKRAHTRLPNYIPAKDTEKLFLHLDKNISEVGDLESYRNRLMVYLQYSCALRVGELRNIESQNFNWETQELRIVDSKTDDRIVPIKNKLKELIFEWNTLKRNAGIKSRFLFVALGKKSFGSKLSYGGSRQIIKKLLKDAGLGEYSPNKLRHSCATHLINSGLGVGQVSSLLGHKNIQSTHLYYARIHRDDEAIIRALNKLD